MQSVQQATVILDEPIDTINPYLHGQFAEHLGELVYDGVWVGEDSAIPNTGGIRNDVVDALRPLELPVLRWPGGCFADVYHWRDGIGPRDERPMRVNVHWGMAPEPNSFGTHEFMRLCRLLGAEPYFAANVGSGSPQELQEWVEYCNFDGRSTLADERRSNGHHVPFNVKYWGIGNENWGCGGNMNPEQYADLFCRYRTYAYDYPGSEVFAIASGPLGGDWDWTRRFFERACNSYWDRRKLVGAFAAHYYCNTAGTSATEYAPDEWLELLAKARAVEGVIVGHRAIMDEFDPQRKIKLIVDEWGAWHPVEPGKPMGGLYQQNTMRDALVAALTLDVFNRHADKLMMANIAQMVNVLQALLLTEGDKCIKTPTYHVFDLYRPHRGATAVRWISQAEHLSDGGLAADDCRKCYLDTDADISLKALEGSASVNNGLLCITACNTHPAEPIDMALTLRAGRLPEAEVVTLAGHDYLSHNTFDRPDAVTVSAPQTIESPGETLRIPMPAGSVVRVMGTLA
ncbi:MAG: alpha-N-arabinofuranosidase [Planctomycetota bacterium]|jgi:alpha-N-arabinofuranosidase